MGIRRHFKGMERCRLTRRSRSTRFSAVRFWNGSYMPNRRPRPTRLLLVASIILAIVACSDVGEFERRISSPDEIYVSEVAVALDAAGVDFRALRDGSIAYRARDENKVASIEQRVKNDIAARASAKR